MPANLLLRVGAVYAPETRIQVSLVYPTALFDSPLRGEDVETHWRVMQTYRKIASTPFAFFGDLVL